MDCLIQAGLFVAAIVAVVALGLYALAAVYCLLAALCFMVLGALDHVFAAGMLSTPPPIMWAVCGALIGSAMGFWTVAPVYGWRKRRPMIALAPVVLILLLAGIAGTTHRPSAYSSPDLASGDGVDSSASRSSSGASPPPAPSRLSASALMGRWGGTFGKSRHAVLEVTHIQGNKFTGVTTLDYSTGQVKLAISGELDNDRKRVVFHEDRVLKQPSAKNWKIGVDTGQLINLDRLSGTGRDSANSSYKWSFLRATRGVGTENPANNTAARAMLGTWTGTSHNNNRVQTLRVVIDKVTDNMFHGTLTQDTHVLKITGEISGHADTVTFRETQQLQGSGWVLGYYRGSLASKHNRMSGSGSDGIGPSYTWDLTK